MSGGATLTRPTRPEHRTCHFVGWRYAYPTYKTLTPSLPFCRVALRLPDLQDLNTVPAVLSGGATLTRPTRPEHRTCRFVGWRYAYPTYKT
ncbi:hypothetical protein [Enterobacter cancerogenus]|uniref:hypothetical protein n=1 Tax=Enterobacter cancerogenus TaxID=69218 RepID=UPI001C7C9D76|nr:hypothetical protein [Enterobacter cancerogenus]